MKKKISGKLTLGKRSVATLTSENMANFNGGTGGYTQATGWGVCMGSRGTNGTPTPSAHCPTQENCPTVHVACGGSVGGCPTDAGYGCTTNPCF